MHNCVHSLPPPWEGVYVHYTGMLCISLPGWVIKGSRLMVEHNPIRLCFTHCWYIQLERFSVAAFCVIGLAKISRISFLLGHPLTPTVDSVCGLSQTTLLKQPGAPSHSLLPLTQASHYTGGKDLTQPEGSCVQPPGGQARGKGERV